MSRESPYPWEVKVLACERIIATQNISEVAREIDVPYATLQFWRREPWWQKVVDEVRAKERAKRNKKLNSIVELSLETVEDRLLNGEQILNNKTGQLVNKPVSLRDAAKVASDIIGEQTRMEKLDRAMTVEQEAIVDTLKMLAQEFAKFNRKNKVEIPFMTNGKRDYKKEVARYTSKPSVIRKRVEQNKARRMMEKAGKVHKGDGKDVDHTKPLSKGGTTTKSNLRVVSRSANRSFSRRADSSLLNQISRRGT
jgi:hypothetical protein